MMQCWTALRATSAGHDAVLDCFWACVSKCVGDAGSVSDIDDLGIISNKSQTWIVEEDCGGRRGDLRQLRAAVASRVQNLSMGLFFMGTWRRTAPPGIVLLQEFTHFIAT
jgi:hypothetical protein